MKLFGIADSFGEFDESWGFFASRPLAEKVLKIVRMAIDESAELIESPESDPWAEQIQAGLLPWKISTELREGQIMNACTTLAWPPAESEGIVEQREDYVEYFFWARYSGEAIGKLARVSATLKPKKTLVEDPEEWTEALTVQEAAQ